jgi:hypothetical protein
MQKDAVLNLPKYVKNQLKQKELVGIDILFTGMEQIRMNWQLSCKASI